MLICSFCSLCSEQILLCDKKKKHTVHHFLWETSKQISTPLAAQPFLSLICFSRIPFLILFVNSSAPTTPCPFAKRLLQSSHSPFLDHSSLLPVSCSANLALLLCLRRRLLLEPGVLALGEQVRQLPAITQGPDQGSTSSLHQASSEELASFLPLKPIF